MACTVDCAGTINGSAYTDACGTCVGGDTGLDACNPDCFTPVVSVLAPSGVAGYYGYTSANSDGWGFPVGYAQVQGTAVLVDDGSAFSDLGCSPLVNGLQLSGNIAVVYRGNCEFSLKALNAQNAGAIAVVVINNQPGPASGMGTGTYGYLVDIPVVMISQDDGALLSAAIQNGTMELLIGNDCVAGCTDSLACNYNPEASFDDASCEFSSCSVCQGDFNGDLVVNFSDWGQFLSIYSCTGLCPGDFNGDLQVNFSDMVLMLSFYGNICN